MIVVQMLTTSATELSHEQMPPRAHLEEPKLSRSRSAKPPAWSEKPPRTGGGSWGLRSRPQSALVSALDGPVSASSRLGDLRSFMSAMSARQQLRRSTSKAGSSAGSCLLPRQGSPVIEAPTPALSITVSAAGAAF